MTNHSHLTHALDSNVECHTCLKTIPAADAHECGRTKCFHFACDACYTGVRYELEVCSDDCADAAARELTAKVCQLQQERIQTARTHVTQLAEAFAAANKLRARYARIAPGVAVRLGKVA